MTPAYIPNMMFENDVEQIPTPSLGQRIRDGAHLALVAIAVVIFAVGMHGAGSPALIAAVIVLKVAVVLFAVSVRRSRGQS